MGYWIKGMALNRRWRKDGVFMFLKAQFSAQIASTLDFMVAVILANVFDLYYVYATFVGAIWGGGVNCVINYKWTFRCKGCKKTHVAVKYILVWLVSLFLNTWGTYLLTELLANKVWLGAGSAYPSNMLFVVPRMIVAFLVALGWNYNMQRIFVYKSHDMKGLFGKKN